MSFSGDVKEELSRQFPKGLKLRQFWGLQEGLRKYRGQELLGFTQKIFPLPGSIFY